MSLSKKTKAHLISALTRKGLANEFEALLTTPAVPSTHLQAAIIAAMGNKAAGKEVIAALQTGGHQVLSGSSTRDKASPNAFRRFLDALCSKSASDEIDPQM